MKRKRFEFLSKENAEVAFERSGGFCVGCGVRAIQWHHIFPQQKWPSLANEPDNVVPVCRRCHEGHTSAMERLPRRVCQRAEHLADARMRNYLTRTYGPLNGR